MHILLFDGQLSQTIHDRNRIGIKLIVSSNCYDCQGFLATGLFEAENYSSSDVINNLAKFCPIRLD